MSLENQHAIGARNLCAVQSFFLDKIKVTILSPGGGTPILGHIRDVRPEWVSFPGRKPADGCKFLTKNLRMGHNFNKIQLGMGGFPLN